MGALFGLGPSSNSPRSVNFSTSSPKTVLIMHGDMGAIAIFERLWKAGRVQKLRDNWPRSGLLILAVDVCPRKTMVSDRRRIATSESIENIFFIVIDTIQFQHRNVFFFEGLPFVVFALIFNVFDNVRYIRFTDAEYSVTILPFK